MKYKLGLILVLILMFFPFEKVFSASCPSDTISKLREYASNVNYDYTYNENNDDIKFTIRFSNVHPSIYVYNMDTNQSYYGNEQGEVIVNNLDDNKKYRFVIKSNTNVISSNYKEVEVIINGVKTKYVYDYGNNSQECHNLNLLDNFVTLPSYNKFYKDELCSGVENHKLCQKWTYNNYNYDEFKKEILNYKKSLNDSDDEKKEKIEINLLDQIIKLIIDNVIYIIVGIILLITIVIVLMKKRKEKSSFNGW